MFRIKKEQMDFFTEKTRRKFRAKVIAFLRRRFEEKVAATSDGELDAWVELAVDKANRYRVNTEPEALQLIVLFLFLGLDVDDKLEWARRVLADKDLYAIGKVRRFLRVARSEGVTGLDDLIVFPEMSDRRNEASPDASEAEEVSQEA